LATLALLMLALACGCSRLRAQDAPPGWPRVWEQRTLFRADSAWIYASSSQAAESAASLAADAASDFRGIVNQPPGDILLIVTDRAESLPPLGGPLAEPLKRIAELGSAGAPNAHVAQAITQTLAGGSMSLAGAPGALTTLPPAAASTPIALVPTTRAIDDAARRLTDLAAESPDLASSPRFLTGPLMAWARSQIRTALTQTARNAVLQTYAASIPLTPEQTKAIADRITSSQSWIDSSMNAAPARP
jgi:hypothetical protein